MWALLKSVSELKVLVVGCGSMAGGLDQPMQASRSPITHAGALSGNDAFRLAGCVDPEDGQRTAFQRKWNIAHGYSNLDEALLARSYDVVSICSPTALHFDHLKRVLDARPRAVLCEKPLTTSRSESRAIVAAYSAASVPLMVNYLRRWDAAMATIETELLSGQWGELRCAIGLYTKGVLHNGGHMVDLFRRLFGNVTAETVFDVRGTSDSADPTVGALLRAPANKPLHMIAGDAEDYPLFELQIVTERGVLTIEGGGLSIRRRAVGDNPIAPSHRFLTTGTTSAGEVEHAMPAVIAELAEVAHGRKPQSSCDGSNALATEEVCHDLIELAHQYRGSNH